MKSINNILAIGTDTKSLVKESLVYDRIKNYSKLCKVYYNFVFTRDNKYIKIVDDNYITIPVYGKNKLFQIYNLFNLIKKEKISKENSIISSQDPFEIGLISYMLSKIYNLRFAVQMHTDISNINFRNESLRNRLQYYISLFVLKRADSIRVVSKRMRDYLVFVLKINQNKIYTIPVYVDIQKFLDKKIENTQKNSLKETDCLMLSRIEKVKNIDLAIDALYEINRKRNQKLTLKIVGSGSDKNRLLEKYKSNDYDFITWSDWSDNSPNEYSKVKILLISSDYEGYAITAIEAVASGIPVVMTPVGCAGELIIENVNGNISKSHNADDFASAIMKAVEDYDTLIQNINSQGIKVNTLEELLSKTKEFYYNNIISKEIKKKLCYILPEASKVTHMKYNVEFIVGLAKRLDVFVIIEKGNSELDNKVTQIKYVNKYYVNSKLSKIVRIIKTLYYIFLARLKGYKIFYVHYSFLAALLASIVPGAKVYYWNCGLPFKYKRSKLIMMYEKFAYKRIDYLVTGTYDLGVLYSNYYKFDKRKILAIPNWINIEEFDKSYDQIDYNKKQKIKEDLNVSDKNKILFFNQRLSERKGVHYILPILKAVSEDVVIIITNDGPYKEKLVEDLTTNNIINRVRMLGKVPRDKLLEILAITDIYILCSEEEGMSHSLMEAMCAGVPAISFDIGSNKEMYPDNFKQYVIADLNINKYIEKINYIFNNNEEQKSFGYALKQKVKEYDKKEVLKDFLEKIFKY